MIIQLEIHIYLVNLHTIIKVEKSKKSSIQEICFFEINCITWFPTEILFRFPVNHLIFLIAFFFLSLVSSWYEPRTVVLSLIHEQRMHQIGTHFRQ